MKSTMTETDLTMDDFRRYFEKNSLGDLFFPNGRCMTPHGQFFENSEFMNFHVRLDDLYKLVSGWRVNRTLVPLDDIVAVIAFGSTVRQPGTYEVTRTRRKYLFFGEKLSIKKTVPIQPNDADFLVITGENLMREEVLEPISIETYDCGTWIRTGGIHLVNRGINQVINGVKANDGISKAALLEGVPIFFNGGLTSVYSRTGITPRTTRKLLWDEDRKGHLTGVIS